MSLGKMNVSENGKCFMFFEEWYENDSRLINFDYDTF